MKIKRETFIKLVLIVITVLCPCISRGAEDAAPAGVFFDINSYKRELGQRADRAAIGIVTIIAYSETGEETGSGSGFFIDTEGRILTNASVLKGAYSAEVFSRSNHYTDVAVLGRNDSYDLALIDVSGADEDPLELDPGYTAGPGEKIMIVGMSRTQEKTVSEGTVHALKSVEGGPGLIKIKAISALSFLPAGDGPVFNKRGKVIGVLTNRNLENPLFGPDAVVTEDVLTAVSAASIRSFLSSSAEAEPLHTAGTRDMVAQLKKTAVNGFIVLYTMGFTKILFIVFAVVLFISMLQWLYYRFNRQ